MQISLYLKNIIYRECFYSVEEFYFEIRLNQIFVNFIDWLIYHINNKFCFSPGKNYKLKYYRDYGKY